MEETVDFWKKCSSCKKAIAFSAKYFVCSVSTCNGLRTGYVFCSVHCFERHLPGARHKDAAAVEMTAPAKAAMSAESRAPARLMATPSAPSSTANRSQSSAPNEVLVIASRLKDYITARSEFNTSASVMDVLSDHLRVVCDRAIDNARAEGRKTVMDRDFSFLKNH
jgi:histone H3/H4